MPPISLPLSLLLLLLFHQPFAVSSDFLSPLLSPLFENVCKQVDCGKGTCRPSQNNIIIPFECVCDPGWKQPFSADAFNFLPCVFPNCTIDFSCSPTASPTPAPEPTSATNGSVFDVCSWDFCGGGTCNKSSSNSSYTCSCSEGYDNLMNSSSLPCFRECALGGDCKNLGITLFNHTAQAPTIDVDDTTNDARSLQYGNLLWFILALFMIAPTNLFA